MSKEINNLGEGSVGKLLYKLAVPAIVANIVNALYNVVDQIFIGQGVGYLGNAATNIAFPLVTLCLAIGLMIGIGSAANLNLELGRKNYEKAKKIVGTSANLLVIIGTIIWIIVILFLKQLMIMFGATEQILSYAMQYTGITSFGVPFLLIAIGINPLVRADGSPKYSMYAIIVGAILNTILDPIFIFVFNMGIAGAAIATVISQIVSATILVFYFTKFKSVKLEKKDFKLNLSISKSIFSLGMASFIFQFSTMIVQVVTNNMLKIYGAATKYGSDIPIASAGVVMKVTIIYFAVVIGLVQGAQPILGFNYGAKKYKRVRETTKILIESAVITATIMTLIFQIFPRQIVSLFGSGNEEYMNFAVRFMRMYLSMLILGSIFTVSLTFFSAIGKAKKGTIISLSKQVIFLLPLTIILPIFLGVTGVIIAGPVSDILAFTLCIFLVKDEFKKMPKS
mgnify:CR=1 FL=1